MVFYRETKWPNVVLEIDLGSRFRTHFGARRNVWAFENVKTLPKQGPEQELVSAVIFLVFLDPKHFKRHPKDSTTAPKDLQKTEKITAGSELVPAVIFSPKTSKSARKRTSRERERARERERDREI